MVLVCFVAVRFDRNFKLVKRLDEKTLAFRSQVTEAGFFGDQIGMADNGSDKESVVDRLVPALILCDSVVKMHSVILRLVKLQGEISETRELELKCKSRLKMAVDLIFAVLVT